MKTEALPAAAGCKKIVDQTCPTTPQEKKIRPPRPDNRIITILAESCIDGPSLGRLVADGKNGHGPGATSLPRRVKVLCGISVSRIANKMSGNRAISPTTHPSVLTVVRPKAKISC